MSKEADNNNSSCVDDLSGKDRDVAIDDVDNTIPLDKRCVSFHVLRHRVIVALGMLLADIFSVSCSFFFAWLLRIPFQGRLSLKAELSFLFWFIASYCLLNLLQGLYEPIGKPIEERIRLQSVSNILLGMGTAFVFFAMKIGSTRSRSFYILLWLVQLFVGPLMRTAVRKIMIRVHLWGLPVAVLGSDKAQIEQMLVYIKEHSETGLRPAIGHIKRAPFVTASHSDPAQMLAGIPFLDEKKYKLTLVSERFTTLIAFGKTVDVLDRIRDEYRACVWNIVAFGNPDSRSEWHGVEFCQFGNYYGLSMNQPLLRRRGRMLKRSLDLLISSSGLALFFPLFLVIMLLIKIESPGPVFFIQKRRGYGGQSFEMLKFRSMIEGDDQNLQPLPDSVPAVKVERCKYQKMKNGQRVTQIGRFLRKTRLDELPELLNILKGEMSLVGPRPLIIGEQTELYGKNILYYDMVRPGLTGAWKISAHSETSYEVLSRTDYQYIMSWSLWKDIVILFSTPVVMIWEKISKHNNHSLM